jgi:hypothetical protein
MKYKLESPDQSESPGEVSEQLGKFLVGRNFFFFQDQIVHLIETPERWNGIRRGHRNISPSTSLASFTQASHPTIRDFGTLAVAKVSRNFSSHESGRVFLEDARRRHFQTSKHWESSPGANPSRTPVVLSSNNSNATSSRLLSIPIKPHHPCSPFSPRPLLTQQKIFPRL